MTKNILPDSRLSQRPDFGCVMGDWQLPSGEYVRIEMQPIFCQCGKMFGYVPRDTTCFAFWLCNKCFEIYGEIAGMWALPEEEFCKNVEYELEARFARRNMTEKDILIEIENNNIGSALAALARESPFPVKK